MKPPYNNVDTSKIQGMIEYLFSLTSDFPYHLKVGTDYMDGSLGWLGGISAYSFSCIRYCICRLSEIIHPLLKNKSKLGYVIEMLIFYILPIILNAVLIPPVIIPMISLFTSFLGSLYQPTINGVEIDAFVYFFAFIFNWGEFQDLSNIQKFPYNFFVYFAFVWYGFILSFFYYRWN